MPYLSFSAICLLFGSNFILMSRASLALGPVAVGALRVIGAAFVLLVAWRLATPGARVPRGKLLGCLGVGLLTNGFPYVVQPFLIAQALATGSGGHSFFGMMVAFTPLLTILVSPAMLGVWPTARQLLGVVLGLFFMGMLVQDGSARGIGGWQLALAFSVPLSYAVGNTYLRRSLNDVPPIALSAALLFSPFCLLTPLSLSGPLLEPLHLSGPSEPQQWGTSLAAVACLGMLGTGLTMWLFVRLVQQQGPLFAGMVTYVVPLIAISWGWADGEQITARQLVAIAGVLVMVALVQFGATAPKAEEAGDDTAPATGEV